MHPFQLLSRWSRRNLVATSANEGSDAPRPVGHEPPAPGPAKLVPIEEITAESDIRGLLAPGAPVRLARAGLRRAWHSDPPIRDFVGLADYNWDFNAPDSIAGFGILKASTEVYRELPSSIGRRAREIIDHEPASPPEASQCQDAARSSFDGS